MHPRGDANRPVPFANKSVRSFAPWIEIDYRIDDESRTGPKRLWRSRVRKGNPIRWSSLVPPARQDEIKATLRSWRQSRTGNTFSFAPMRIYRVFTYVRNLTSKRARISKNSRDETLLLLQVLKGEDEGVVVEFVNPKYKPGSRTEFKKPTRLECMMQDFPKLMSKELGDSAKVRRVGPSAPARLPAAPP